jgi:predicted secreted protein
MAYQGGKPFVLKLGLDGAGGVIAGTKNLSMKISNGSVDVSNKSSSGWQEMLESAGLQSITLTMDGICTDDAKFETLRGYAQSNTINPFLIVSPDNSTVACNFFVSDFTQQGGYNDAFAFSATLMSDGVPTFTNV